MRKMHNLLGAVAAMGLVATAACSGGSEGPPPSADSEEADAAAEEAEAPDAPTPDSTDTLDGTVFADFTGDTTAGEAVFAQCRTCHVVDPGVNRTGPSLHNIVGREAGQVEGFNYTDANANSGITWTPEKLFQYLENPHRVIPGTRMAFAGLSEAQDRADLIAFLQTHSE
ncbi:cytochrome c family protein [Parasphingopyxis algicola]|uniref:c-type cytochrome n=1 Tax=Parasphingopyxis algicola TaxID=2026624 RepID=UPI0015A07FD3|nr:cytochrome c family protein [Parasphingopyxis algicola]QLC24765.1 cytochrome c family protein [Parasphingopyxis algicola]